MNSHAMPFARLDPVKLIVPWPPAGAVDIAARIVEKPLAQAIGQPLVVENKAGASGTIGTQDAIRAKPDGYTLLLFSSHASNAGLAMKVSYDWTRELAPVGPIARATNVLVAGKSSGIESVRALLEKARARPGGLTIGSAGVGSASHLAGVMLESLAGIRLESVPYKGSAPAINDLLGGHIDIFIAPLPAVISYIEDGRVKALGVTSVSRSPLLPDVPTIAEAGVPGYEADQWLGLYAPLSTPPEAIALLNRRLNEVLQRSEVRDQLQRQGLAPLTGSAEDLRDTALADLGRMRKLAEVAGLKPQ